MGAEDHSRAHGGGPRILRPHRGDGQRGAGLQRGRPGLGEGHITCGYCRNCRAGRRHLCRNTVGVGVNRPGAFAQYLRFPRSMRSS
ncbi:MAG: alcohol dehydrogenase catalytic domain-containing protein [Gammaproteobacteria bacterium]